MNILIVNPPRYNGIPVIREERCEITERYSVLEPYSLLQISAQLRDAGHTIHLIDANGFDISYEELAKEKFNQDILIFRFTPTTYQNDLKIAELAKKKNPKIFIVGICFTLHTLGKDVLKKSKFLDVYIGTDYEVVVLDLVNNLGNLHAVKGIVFREKGKIIENAPAIPIRDYDSIPLPAYDLLPSLKPYFINTPWGKPVTIMYASRGCPFKCAYCTVAGTMAKMRSAKSVIKEVQFLKKTYNIKTISFFDETFTINRKRVEDICAAIKDLKITWYCNTRANLITPDLLKIMREAGCKGISFGVESGSDKILKGVNKAITVEQQAKGVKMAKEAGIKTFCSFIIGLPGETEETIQETLNFVKETLPTSAQFNVAVPYPGTALYDMALKNKWIDKIDWETLYQHESIMKNQALTGKQLEDARMRAYRTLYFNPKWILSNVWHVMTNPEDFILATRYAVKIFKNFFIYKMRDAH
jgi:radical SAM superfamily enzyme YgiQ (UPF0313 family)